MPQQRNQALRRATLLLLILPAFGLPAAFFMDLMGGKPFERLIEETGSFALRFLVLALAITPLSRVLRWPSLIGIRRRVGVASFLYALAHLGLFAIHHNEGPIKLLQDILTGPKLLIGFTALTLLLPLALTSTDRMIQRLGTKRWCWLHRLVYLIAPIALLHFLLESPASSIEPMLLGGCVFWLLGYRLWQRIAGPAGYRALLALSLAAASITALADALFQFLETKTAISETVLANLDLATALRPAPLVFGLGLALTIARLIRQGGNPARPIPESSATTRA